MRTFNEQLSTAIVLNADYVSPFAPLKNIFVYSISVNIAGTPTGTLTLEGSNDPETNDTQYNTVTNTPPSKSPTNWSTIKDSNLSVTTAGNNMYNVSDVAYNFVRVRYVDGSSGASTAVMNIVFNGKGQ